MGWLMFGCSSEVKKEKVLSVPNLRHGCEHLLLPHHGLSHPPILYSDIGSRHEIQLCESPLQKVVILIRTKFWTYINEGQKTELQGSVFNHSSTYWKVCYVPYILQEERINKTPWKNSYPVGINEVSVPRAGDIPENKIRHLSRSLYYINLSPVRAILISMWASV